MSASHFLIFGALLTNMSYREEEDPDEYPFPLTLRTKRSGPASPLGSAQLNGS